MTENSESLPKANRQVDLKALLSHIIKGDGMDKCRICMGDTSQGQVHLGDTVMMDGEKPVTLAELLETITGVQVAAEEELPPALCQSCYSSVIEATNFRTLVRDANCHWTNLTQLLEHVTNHKYSKKSDRICAYISDNDIYITDSCTVPESNENNDNIENDFLFKRFSKQHKCSCPACGKNFSYPLQLYKHLKESADLVRACHVCAQIMSRNVLKEHLSNKHEVEAFECEKCPALFLNRPQYKLHMVKAHAEGACMCGDCGRTFRTAKAFHAHQSLHKLSSCPNCDTLFRNRSCYSYHIKKCCNIDESKAVKSKVTVTLPKKQNKKLKIGVRGSANKECICDYCKKKFTGKKSVAAHIQIVHTRDTHRPCAHCGKIFANAYMTTHLKTHQLREYKCDQCGVTLKSKLGFSQHLRLHTGEKPYACKICGESFSAASRRSDHMFNTHKKAERELKQVCVECPAKFRLPCQLKQHVMRVHNNLDDWHWECEKCKQKFPSCRSLLHHIKKHKAEA